MTAPVSAVVITQNEEEHIEPCLRSLSWAAETIVVDALSTDRTAERAEAAGARVFRRPWEGYSAQKNFGVAQATQPWILNIDADEAVTPELAAEIQDRLSAGVDESAFAIRVPLYFLGRLLGHYGRGRRDPGHVRLFRKDRAHFNDRLVHEAVVVDGPVGMLQSSIDHDSYPPPALVSYWRKIHRYANLEASQRAEGHPPVGGRWMRAAGKLGWMLIVRRGLFHGPAAWIWIAGQAYQEWMTTAKAARLRRRTEVSRDLA